MRDYCDECGTYRTVDYYNNVPKGYICSACLNKKYIAHEVNSSSGICDSCGDFHILHEVNDVKLCHVCRKDLEQELMTGRCDRCKEVNKLYIREDGRFCYDCKRVVQPPKRKTKEKVPILRSIKL